MAKNITLRNNTATNTGKGAQMTHPEMDANLETFFMSSSLDGTTLYLHSTGSANVDAIDLSGLGGAGAQGIQGIQGFAGVGTQGIQGIDGAGTQGIQGLVGTGVQGTDGTQGLQGIAGGAASQGIQGTQGSQGLTGTGIQGIQGAEGAQGTQGIQGAQGTQGAQGIQGTDGTQGTQGIQGIQGAQGIQGTQGTQGIQGVKGPQGAQGIQGTDGIAESDFYHLPNLVTGGIQGINVLGKVVAGSTQIMQNTSAVTVSIGEIANLTLGEQVHITATGWGPRSIPVNVTVQDPAGATTLPLTLNQSGQIEFKLDSLVDVGIVYIMYHVWYTTDTFPT